MPCGIRSMVCDLIVRSIRQPKQALIGFGATQSRIHADTVLTAPVLAIIKVL